MKQLRLALAQINTTVGDLAGNSEKILEWTEKAKNAGADIVAFPELTITGYPPEDLLLKRAFVAENLEYLEKVASGTKGIVSLVGFVDRSEGIYNALAIIRDGKVRGVYRKMYLPNYGVFDEKRYFESGSKCLVFTLGGINIGVNICEDIWHPDGPARTEALAGGAHLVINTSASPYHAGKCVERQKMLATRAAETSAFIGYVNLVGGQDELLFDGGSLVIDEFGKMLGMADCFEEDLLTCDLDFSGLLGTKPEGLLAANRMGVAHSRKDRINFLDLGKAGVAAKNPLKPRLYQALPLEDEIYKGLILGTCDYVRKNGFTKVVIGISGGIDSALTAAVSVDALGKENVLGVSLPSQFTSPESIEDAEKLCRNLGIKLVTIPITGVFDGFKTALKPVFDGLPEDITEENLQARIRGTMLMAISNKFGHLLFSTGNKSELSTGYCTLYGDMAGGFAVLKDVPKELVYTLARFRNRRGSPIPERVLTRPPSAELKPDQQDEDTLPPYSILDPILEFYIERDMSLAEIISEGYDEKVAKAVVEMVDRSEYKRRQGPQGIKISPRAFGKDRRLPITNWYREKT